MVRSSTILSKPEEVLKLENWTQELERRGTSHPQLPWRRERNSRSLGSESGEGADEINIIFNSLSSVLLDVTDNWLYDAAAQLCDVPVLDTMNTNLAVFLLNETWGRPFYRKNICNVYACVCNLQLPNKDKLCSILTKFGLA
jgi:hypothetical protein